MFELEGRLGSNGRLPLIISLMVLTGLPMRAAKSARVNPKALMFSRMVIPGGVTGTGLPQRKTIPVLLL